MRTKRRHPTRTSNCDIPRGSRGARPLRKVLQVVLSLVSKTSPFNTPDRQRRARKLQKSCCNACLEINISKPLVLSWDLRQEVAGSCGYARVSTAGRNPALQEDT